MAYIVLGFGIGFGLAMYLTVRDMRQLYALLERLTSILEKTR